MKDTNKSMKKLTKKLAGKCKQKYNSNSYPWIAIATEMIGHVTTALSILDYVKL